MSLTWDPDERQKEQQRRQELRRRADRLVHSTSHPVDEERIARWTSGILLVVMILGIIGTYVLVNAIHFSSLIP